MGNKLQVHLFGGIHFQFTTAATPLRFRSQRTELFLAYLILAPQPLSREWTAAFLWDDRTQKQSLANLRGLLSRMPKAIKPYVLTTRSTVAFNHERPYRLDTAEFERLITRLEQDGPLTAADLSALETAAELAQRPFLEGSYASESRGLDEWMSLTRERFLQQQTTLLRRLARHYLHHRAYGDGIRHARRLVALDRLREDSYRLLMRLQARAGHRPAALQTFDRVRHMLNTEFGLAPHPDTAALARRLRTAPDTIPHHLPRATTPFVGRTADQAALHRKLDRADCRLLTLVGLGGAGKSRLAVQVAHERRGEYLHGIHFVPLITADPAAHLPTLLARAFHLRAESGTDPAEQLLDFVRHKQMLLLLDNFESLLVDKRRAEAAVDFVRRLLDAAPDLQLLITSRHRLYLQAEWVHDLAGLTVPPTDDPAAADPDPAAYEAVEMLHRFARRQGVDLSSAGSPETAPAVRRICRLVAGLPLGLELAAATLVHRPPSAVADAIAANADELATKMRDMPARHRSVRAVFDYSWRLLPADERPLLAALSAFRGGFTAEAAHAVIGVTGAQLAAWVGRSLLQPGEDENGRERFDLHPLLRHYLAGRMDASAADTAARAHVDFFLDLAASAPPALQGRNPLPTLDTLTAELDNLRRAWQTAIAHGDTAGLHRAAPGLAHLCLMRGFYPLGRQLFAQAVAAVEQQQSAVPDEHYGRLLAHLGNFHAIAGRYDAAETYLYRALERVPETAVDAPLTHIALSDAARWRSAYERAETHAETAHRLAHEHAHPHQQAAALSALGSIQYHRGHSTAAADTYERAFDLYARRDNLWQQSRLYRQRGLAQYRLGRYAAARKLFAEGLLLKERLGDEGEMAAIYNNLGIVADVLGEYDTAADHYAASLRYRQASGERRGLVLTYINLGVINLRRGAYAPAEENLRAGLAVSRELKDKRRESLCLTTLGSVAQHTGRAAEAADLYRRGLALRERIGDRRSIGWSHYHLGDLARQEGALVEAADHLQHSLEIRRELDDHWGLLFTLCGLGWLAVAEGDLSTADRHFRAALAEADQNPAVCARALGGMAAIAVRRGDVDTAAHWLRLIIAHPATEQDVRGRAEADLAALDVTAPDDDADVRVELNTAVESLLNQPSEKPL